MRICLTSVAVYALAENAKIGSNRLDLSRSCVTLAKLSFLYRGKSMLQMTPAHQPKSEICCSGTTAGICDVLRIDRPTNARSSDIVTPLALVTIRTVGAGNTLSAGTSCGALCIGRMNSAA
jgi:hypothetical protein